MASTLSYSDFSTDNKVENFNSKRRKNKTFKKSKKVKRLNNS